jgi:ABC-2 type transport system permease protein
MTDSTNVVPSPAAQSNLSVAAQTRPLYWSVRRELWEHRWLYIVPLIVAGISVAAYLYYATKHLTERIGELPALDPARRHLAIAAPYDYVAIALILVTLFVSAYYCLDALHGERRDRSILFWKSLPVSDLLTVASKAVIPFVVLPVIAVAVILAAHVLMLLFATVILWAGGGPVSLPWTEVRVFTGLGVLIYGLVTLVIWLSPIYGWLVLVSVWAQRVPFLWAVLPPAAICLIEKLALGTSHFWSMLKFRLSGGFSQAFVIPDLAATAHERGGGQKMTPEQFTQVFNPVPDPLKFLESPWVWIGLAVAVAFFALAVWLRRYRDPI